MSKLPRRWGQPGWWLASDPLEHASPLLVDALHSAGLDLARLLEVAGASYRGMVGVLRVHPLRREGGTVQLMDAAGTLRRCEIQRRGGCLEMSLTLNDRGTFVSTHRNQATINLDMIVPESLRIVARGRPLIDLIDHPLLQRDEYVIRRVRNLGRLGLAAVTFDAPMVRIAEHVVKLFERHPRRG